MSEIRPINEVLLERTFQQNNKAVRFSHLHKTKCSSVSLRDFRCVRTGDGIGNVAWSWKLVYGQIR